MPSYDTLKLKVIGHVYRKWEEMYGEWLVASGRTEDEVVFSLRAWAEQSVVLEECDLTAADALEWRQEYRRELGEIE